MVDGGRVDFERCVVVEEDGGIQMARPGGLLVNGHLRGGLGRAPAVEAAEEGEGVSDGGRWDAPKGIEPLPVRGGRLDAVP